MAEPKFTLAFPTKQDLERFHSKYICGLKPDDCHTWLASLNTEGYGQIYWHTNKGPKKTTAQRIAYFLDSGVDPNEMYVLHCCDNRLCVNPCHLFLGTHLDNIKDKMKKGRQSKGGMHGRAKITEDDVRAMRLRFHDSDLSPYKMALALAPAYPHLTICSIRHILTGYSWKHVRVE